MNSHLIYFCVSIVMYTQLNLSSNGKIHHCFHFSSFQLFLLCLKFKFYLTQPHQKYVSMLCYLLITSWAPRRCPGLFHNFIVKKSCAD
jgi:hypothetical protein